MKELAGRVAVVTGASRVALVTGASRGIGVRLAQALARERMKLVLVARSADKLEALAKELSAAGTDALALPADLSSTGEMEKVVERATAHFGAIDVLVNNAAVMKTSRYHQLRPDEIASEVGTDLVSPMILTALVIPGMLQRRRGHIVNISSLAGKGGAPYHAPYATSKAGLIAFTQSLRQEYRGTGVSASVICPGYGQEEGMFQDMKDQTGASAPPLIGTTPDAVARALVHAIRHDSAQLLVNRVPAAPLMALLEVAPRTGERILRALGAFKPFDRWIEMQAADRETSGP